MQIRPRSDKNARLTGIPQLAPIAGAIKRILAMQERTDSPRHGGGAPAVAAAPLTDRQEAQRASAKRVRFEPLEPRVLMSADPIPVSGTLNTPGQVDHYSFTLTTATHLVFDSLTNNSNIDWTLTGPQGAVVTNRSFNSSDGSSDSATPVLDLSAGTYSVAINAVADATGSYSFRLINADQATAIVPGTAVTGTLNPANQTNVYQFTANAGDPFYFGVNSVTGSTPVYWHLVDPLGNTVFGPNAIYSGGGGYDIGTTQLKLSGTYTLLMEGPVGATGTTNYSLTVYPVTATTAAMSLGTPVTGNITSPGQTNSYTFSLNQETLAYFDSLTNNSNLSWSLSGPPGTVVAGRSFTGSDSFDQGSPVMDLVAGNYTLPVAGAGPTTAGFSFNLLDLSQATDRAD